MHQLGLSTGERAIIEARLRLLEASSEVQARIIGPLREEYVDVILFACSSDTATADLFERLTAAVSAQPYIGRLRSRLETFPGSRAVQPGISVVVDTSHPEKEEGVRIVDALERFFPGEVQVVPNEDAETPWYISIVACAP